MKISGFAKVYDLKKTAIRYYTTVKLLNPKQTGEYINYDACHDEMKYILMYRDMGFDIDETVQIKELENAIDEGSNNATSKLKAILNAKISEIKINIRSEEEKIKDLERTIEEIC